MSTDYTAPRYLATAIKRALDEAQIAGRSGDQVAQHAAQEAWNALLRDTSRMILHR